METKELGLNYILLVAYGLWFPVIMIQDFKDLKKCSKWTGIELQNLSILHNQNFVLLDQYLPHLMYSNTTMVFKPVLYTWNLLRW